MSCKSHIAPVSLTDWCIMIFILNKNSFFLKHLNVPLYVGHQSEMVTLCIGVVSICQIHVKHVFSSAYVAFMMSQHVTFLEQYLTNVFLLQ